MLGDKVPLRPRLFPADAPPAAASEAAEPASSVSEGSPGSSYCKLLTLYLDCRAAVKGVLQLHKALLG